MQNKNITNSIVASYKGWDEGGGDYGDVQLYDVVLAVDTKKFKKGDVVQCATFLFSESKVQLWNKSGTEIIEEIQLGLVLIFN